jgi:hypothetical protein
MYLNPDFLFEWSLITSRRKRTPGCQMARWRLECRIAVANEPVRYMMLWLRMPKWESWLKRE